jgi:MFS family permease
VGFLVFALVLFEIDEFELWTYQVLLGVAVVGRYASLIWQQGIRTSAYHLDVVGHGWWMQLRKNISAPGLTRFVLFATWSSFWLAFVGPFIPVFSFEALGLPPGHFTFLVILSTISGIFGWWYWGRRVDIFGCLPVLIIGLVLWELQSFLWAVLTRDNLWLLYPMWIFGGFVATAYFAASFNLLLKLVPSDAKLTGVSLHLALTSIAAAVAPVVAGLLLNRFLTDTDDLLPYRIGFVVKSTAVLAGLILLRGLREPQRTTQATFTGAFRTIRQLISSQGAANMGRSG